MAGQAAAEALAEATDAAEAARQELEEVRGRMRAVDAAAAEISGGLGRLAGAARAAADEAKRLEAAVGAAQRSADKDQAKHGQLKGELAQAEAEEERAADPELENLQADDEREELAQRAAAARNAEMEARLEVRTVEERLRAISGRADSLAASAGAERAARERAAVRRRQRAAQASVARAVAAGAGSAVAAAESSLTLAAQQRAEAEAASASGTEALKAARAQVTTVSGELDKVVNTAHGTEISRHEHRLRLDQLAGHVADEYGIEPDALAAEYGPDTLVLVPSASPLAAAARKRGAVVTVVPRDAPPHRRSDRPAGGLGRGWPPGTEAGPPKARAGRYVPGARADQANDGAGTGPPGPTRASCPWPTRCARSGTKPRRRRTKTASRARPRVRPTPPPRRSSACPTCAKSRRRGRRKPSGSWPGWARSTRWRWRSTRRCRNGTSSSPPSSRTCARPAATC